MTDIELAISRSKALEALLRRTCDARGRGLHELTDDVEHKLPADVVKKLRFVATLRNKIVHEEDYEKLDDRRGFVRAADAAEEHLAKLGDKRALLDGMFLRTAAFVVITFLVGVVIIVYLMWNL
ncbi:MAG: DUF4145 domain-containing protein [Planctomycetota bacterium]